MDIDAREIKNLFKGTQDYLKELHRRFDDVFKYYNLEYQVKVPAGFVVHKPPTPRTNVESLAAALHPADISVIVPPRTQKRGKVEAEKEATALGKFGYAVLTRMDRVMNYSLLQETLKAAVMWGMAVVKGTLYNPMLWGPAPRRKEGQTREDWEEELEEWEGRRRARLPLEMMAVSPRNIYPDPKVFTGEEPEFVFEAYKRIAGGIPFELPRKYEYYKEVEWLEYHTKTERVYMVNDDIVFVSPNHYGYIPYHISFSGLGINSPWGKPEHKAVGIMYPLLSTYAAEARMMTALDIVTQYLGVPVFRIPPELKDKGLDLSPGYLNVIDAQHKVEPLFERVVNVGREIYDGLSLIDSNIEKATYGKQLAGLKQAGVDTGIQQQLITIQAYKRFEALIQTLEHVWGELAGESAFIMEHLAREAFTEHIKVEEIKGQYLFNVRFIIVDEIQRQSMINSMRSLEGIYSKRTLREKFPVIEVGEDEEEQILMEQLYQSPAVLTQLSQRMLEQAVGLRQLAEVQEQQQRRTREGQVMEEEE